MPGRWRVHGWHVLCRCGCFGMSRFSRDPGARGRILHAVSAASRCRKFRQSGPMAYSVVESLGTGGGFSSFSAPASAMPRRMSPMPRWPMTSSEVAECAHRWRRRSGKGIRVDWMAPAARQRQECAGFCTDARTALSRRGAPACRVTASLFSILIIAGAEISPELPDLPIRIYGPAPNHGTRDALWPWPSCRPASARLKVQSLSPAERRLACQAVRERRVDRQRRLRRAAASPAGRSAGHGRAGFSYLDNNRDKLKAARIEGVDPTPESISAWTIRSRGRCSSASNAHTSAEVIGLLGRAGIRQRTRCRGTGLSHRAGSDAIAQKVR